MGKSLKLTMMAGATTAVVVLVASAVVSSQQQPPNQPGQATTARVQIINRGPTEALPVIVHSGGDVQPVAVISLPAVSFAANAAVATQTLRQNWEYRIVTAKTADELTAALNRAGAEAWEAIGVATPAGSFQAVLKRPR